MAGLVTVDADQAISGICTNWREMDERVESLSVEYLQTYSVNNLTQINIGVEDHLPAPIRCCQNSAEHWIISFKVEVA